VRLKACCPCRENPSRGLRNGGLLVERSYGLWCEQIHVAGADKFIKALVKQVYKLPNVRKVVLLTDVSRVERGLVLIKVGTPPGTRTEIMELVSIFRGSVVDVSDETLTIAVKIILTNNTRPFLAITHSLPILYTVFPSSEQQICWQVGWTDAVLVSFRGLPCLPKGEDDPRSIRFQTRPNRCDTVARTLLACARNHPFPLWAAICHPLRATRA
jgi:hypothetical protein